MDIKDNNSSFISTGQKIHLTALYPRMITVHLLLTIYLSRDNFALDHMVDKVCSEALKQSYIMEVSIYNKLYNGQMTHAVTFSYEN